MSGWAESVDRVLTLRKIAALEADRDELIRIIQEIETRFAVVVNRRAHESLRDVPSWKDPELKSPAAAERRRMTRMGGMKVWADRRRTLEKKLSVNSERMKRRVEEFRQALGEDLGPDAKVDPFETVGTSSEPRPESVAVETVKRGDGDVGA